MEFDGMISRLYRSGSAMAAAVVIVVGASSCRRGGDDPAQPTRASAPAPVPKPQVLFFDDALRVEDATVNEFVERAMEACASGDYERIRLMWTARGEPISRSDFEQSWHDVRRVTIRILKPVMLAGAAVGSPPTPEPGYAFVADVQFDPDSVASPGEPGREAALTIVRENDEWRLASAPKAMRLWLDEQLGRADIIPASAEPENRPTP